MLSAGSSGGCLGFLAIQPAQGIGLQACNASWEMCYTFQITVEQKFCIKDSHLQGTLCFIFLIKLEIMFSMLLKHSLNRQEFGIIHKFNLRN